MNMNRESNVDLIRPLNAAARRINVSIPADMVSKLGRHRDRFNISAVCQAALRKELAFWETELCHPCQWHPPTSERPAPNPAVRRG